MQEPTPLIRQGWLRALVFTIVYLLLNVIIGGVVMLYVGSPEPLTTNSMLIVTFAELLVSVPAVLLFRKMVDRKSLESLGIKWQGNERHAATGFFSGLFILAGGSLILLLLDYLDFIGLDFSSSEVLLLLLVMVMVAIYEELVIRGYILNNLLESTNKWVALGISSVVFSLFHLGNPGVTWMSLLGIFIGGVLLGINYIYTRNLWFSVIFHLTWNFFQGPVFGYEVSGVETSSILVQSLKGPEMLNGGPFGFEASILAFVLMALVTAFLVSRYSKQFVR